MSHDGLVVSGWGAIARTQELAAPVVQDHIDQEAKEAVPSPTAAASPTSSSTLTTWTPE